MKKLINKFLNWWYDHTSMGFKKIVIGIPVILLFPLIVIVLGFIFYIEYFKLIFIDKDGFED